jgi:hypothetical protein
MNRPTIQEQLAEAAQLHVTALAKWFQKIPAAQRAELANYLTEIVTNLDALSKQMPPTLNPLEIAGPAQQLWGLMKGYEGGKLAVAAALRRLIPELGPLADALLDETPTPAPLALLP